MEIGCAPTGFRGSAKFGPVNQSAASAAPKLGKTRPAGMFPKRGQQVDPIQEPADIRAELQAGADLRQLLGLLEDLNFPAAPREAESRRHASDATACDQRLHDMARGRDPDRCRWPAAEPIRSMSQDIRRESRVLKSAPEPPSVLASARYRQQ